MAEVRRFAWRLRWLWRVLVFAGLALIAWRYWGSGITKHVNQYFDADIATRDQLTSPYSLAFSIFVFVVSLLGMFLQSKPVAAPVLNLVTPGSSPQAGTASLHIARDDTVLEVRGRDDVVKELTGMYRRWGFRRPRDRVRVLHGAGGGGKTTIARAVAMEVHHRGGEVWWVSASSASQLQIGMRVLARRLGATDQELENEWADSATDVLWRRLANYEGRWLLVVDNADEPAVLAPAGEPITSQRGWIRPVADRNGGILITSRDRNRQTWGSWCKLHEVLTLTPEVGALILLDHAGQMQAGTRAEAEALARRLGGLPLALGLAGLYLAESQRVPLPGGITTYSTYLTALEADGLAAVPIDRHQGQDDAEQARRIITHTWELSLDQLANRGLPQARSLLRLLSMFADAPIPLEIFNPELLGSCELLRGITTASLRGLLHGLHSLGLIELTTANLDDPDDRPAIRIHPLIREAIAHHVIGNNDQLASLTALGAQLLLAAAEGLDASEDPVSWPLLRFLTPHPAHLLSVLEQVANPEQTTIVRSVAAVVKVSFLLAGSGVSAYGLDLTALEAASKLLGPNHPFTLHARNNLATWTGRAGDALAARDLFAELVPLHEEILGAKHPDTLLARGNLAAWTGKAGDAVAARDLYAELLPLRVEVLGATHPDTLLTRGNLAAWTGNAGDAVAARDLFAELLPLQEEVRGARHPETLATRGNLAAMTGKAGDAVAARDLYAELLPLYVEVRGTRHPETLLARGNLAAWTARAGDVVAARDLYAELLPLQEEVLGATHPDTLLTRGNLAASTGEAGDAVAARDLFAELLPLQEEILGAKHPDTLLTRGNLAASTGEAGDVVAARDLFAELLPLYVAVLGATHPGTLKTRRSIAFWTEKVSR